MDFGWFFHYFMKTWKHRSQQIYEMKMGVTVLVQEKIAIPWRIKLGVNARANAARNYA